MRSKVVAITGGFGVLGAAVARAFAASGASVALIDRTAQAPSTLSEEFAQHLLIGNVDLADSSQAAAAVSQVQSRFGRLDALINVAGGFRWETVAQGSVDTWDLLYTMNLKTAVCASQAALPVLLSSGQGRIVNIGAGAALKAGVGMGAYAASKSGVARLTEALAEEVKDQGVTVNAILPSIIDTPQNRADMPDADFKRWVTPESIAQVAVFLASDAAAAITGALIPVSGRV